MSRRAGWFTLPLLLLAWAWAALIVVFYCFPVALAMLGIGDWILTGGSGWKELTDGQRQRTLTVAVAALAVPVYLKIVGPDIIETLKHTFGRKK